MNHQDLEKLATAKRTTGKALVLIIEDNLKQQKLYRLIKDETGMLPCIVSTCEEGMEAAKFVNFNLIILDLGMPNAGAIECAKKIQEIERKRGIRTPIITVTARAMSGDREKCLDAGMDDYLSKPFSIVELREKISIWAA